MADCRNPVVGGVICFDDSGRSSPRAVQPCQTRVAAESLRPDVVRLESGRLTQFWTITEKPPTLMRFMSNGISVGPLVMRVSAITFLFTALRCAFDL